VIAGQVVCLPSPDGGRPFDLRLETAQHGETRVLLDLSMNLPKFWRLLRFCHSSF